MKLGELKEQLKDIPDDSEVSGQSYLNDERIALVFSLGPAIIKIYLEPYPGLPT